MEELILNASILAGIICIVVGFIKLPIKKFKDKTWYRPLLTLIMLILACGGCVLDQIYFIHAPIMSWSFLLLVALTLAEIFISYNVVYEGFNIKTLIHKWLGKIAAAKSNPETQLAKTIAKFEKAVSNATGLDATTMIDIVNNKFTQKDKEEPAASVTPSECEPSTTQTGNTNQNPNTEIKTIII